MINIYLEMLNLRRILCDYDYCFSIPLCTLVNQYLANLARKFPATKFLKSISTICIPNWPDRNLPTIFIYYNGNIVKQIVGAIELRGMKLTEEGIIH